MTKLKVLITGGSGLVGSHFIKQVNDFEILAPLSSEFDLTDPIKISKYLEEKNPDWIINFAAFTDVNAAENQRGDEMGSAWQINVVGVQNILDAFRSKNFIQISTDMVFPGNLSQPGPYDETDLPPETPGDLTWYGWTKNRAEKIVRKRGAILLRIIYPVRATFDQKTDYIRGPLQKIAEGKMYPLFHDQQVSVSLVGEISETISKIIEFHSEGIFHVVSNTSIEEISHSVYHVSSDTTSPHELIKRVLDELGLDSSNLRSSSILDYLKTQTNQSRYPVYGGLKTKKTEDRLGLHFSTWQTVVDHLIDQGLKLPSKQ